MSPIPVPFIIDSTKSAVDELVRLRRKTAGLTPADREQVDAIAQR